MNGLTIGISVVVIGLMLFSIINTILNIPSLLRDKYEKSGNWINSLLQVIYNTLCYLAILVFALLVFICLYKGDGAWGIMTGRLQHIFWG